MFNTFILLAVTCKSAVHTERILRLHCNHVYANAPQCYVIHTYTAFLVFCCVWHSGWSKLACRCNKATEKACMQVQIDVGTKCNSLTQQFIGISTTIDTWATYFDSIESSSGPQRLQIQFLQGSQVHCGICSLWGPEDNSIKSKHVAHVSIVVDIPINCCVRLLNLVPILLY